MRYVSWKILKLNKIKWHIRVHVPHCWSVVYFYLILYELIISIRRVYWLCIDARFYCLNVGEPTTKQWKSPSIQCANFVYIPHTDNGDWLMLRGSRSSLGTSRPFIYEIDSSVTLWQPFRRTISKMEDSNKETSLKAFKMLFPFRLTFTLIV